MASVDIGGYQYWDIKKGQFQFSVSFLFFFLVCKLYKSGLYINVLDMGNVLFEGF